MHEKAHRDGFLQMSADARLTVCTAGIWSGSFQFPGVAADDDIEEQAEIALLGADQSDPVATIMEGERPIVMNGKRVLSRIAHVGHYDNSTQPAKRLLTFRFGIDWSVGK